MTETAVVGVCGTWMGPDGVIVAATIVVGVYEAWTGLGVVVVATMVLMVAEVYETWASLGDVIVTVMMIVGVYEVRMNPGGVAAVIVIVEIYGAWMNPGGVCRSPFCAWTKVVCDDRPCVGLLSARRRCCPVVWSCGRGGRHRGFVWTVCVPLHRCGCCCFVRFGDGGAMRRWTGLVGPRYRLRTRRSCSHVVDVAIVFLCGAHRF